MMKPSWKFFPFLTVMLLSACGVVDTAEQTLSQVQTGNHTQSEIKRINEEIKEILSRTHDAVHLQILTTALQQMLSPENTKVLNPPSRMMPYARAFAREGTEKEIIEVSFMLLQAAISAPPELIEFRMVSLTAMAAVAGFTSIEKVRSIFKNQIEDKGRHEETAYAFGVCRYTFLRDFLFNPILDSRYINIGSLRDGVENFRALNHLAQVPYRELLSLEIPSLELSLKIEPERHKALARKAYRRFLDKLEESVRNSPEAIALLKEFEI